MFTLCKISYMDDFGWQVIGYLGKEAQNYCTKFFFLFLLLLLISKLVSTALSFLVVWYRNILRMGARLNNGEKTKQS